MPIWGPPRGVWQRKHAVLEANTLAPQLPHVQSPGRTSGPPLMGGGGAPISAPLSSSLAALWPRPPCGGERERERERSLRSASGSRSFRLPSAARTATPLDARAVSSASDIALRTMALSAPSPHVAKARAIPGHETIRSVNDRWCESWRLSHSLLTSLTTPLSLSRILLSLSLEFDLT